MTNVDRRSRESDVSLSDLLTAALRARRLLIGLAVGAAVLAALTGLLSKREFTSSATFIPQGGDDQLAGLAGLAGQFGLQVPTPELSNGPEFYQSLLSSREVLAPVLSHTSQPVRTGEASTSLLDLFEIEGDTQEERLDRGVEWFRDNALRTMMVSETGVVGFSVTTRWPDVSRQLVIDLLQQIQQFNTDTRRSQARAEREFLEERVDSARANLLASEDALQRFLLENRRYDDSPDLQFAHDRLLRVVTMRHEVYTGMVQAYENARLKEVRDTPVITIIERPNLPARPESRRIAVKVLLSAVLASLVGLTFVFARLAPIGE